ncbi:energy transducer TonB [Hoylesella oralis]|uniref:energy transducer TonB n=1 Tax=Hoylesella oralis TaxID=28134 RepID=UPI0028F03C25|nr:energy transducer TonB [Hoylesella oralis]
MLIFVTEDGLLSNVIIVRSVTPAFDKEALRIVRSMPRWMPGTQNGKVVRVKHNIPINFRAY